MNKKNKNKKITCIPSSGNVFDDLGLNDADELLKKADLAIEISNIIKERKLTQTKAAKILGIPQPKISDLNTGKVLSFSIDRLIRLLGKLDQEVEIKVRPRKEQKTLSKSKNNHIKKDINIPLSNNENFEGHVSTKRAKSKSS